MFIFKFSNIKKSTIALTILALFIFVEVTTQSIFKLIVHAQELSCTSYLYGEWSTCTTSGMQYRTILSSEPTGCYQTSSAPPVLSQTCTLTTSTTCSYEYSNWSECGASCTQKRTVDSVYPTGCYASPTSTPILEQTCTKVPCSYTYSDWGTCTTTGIQTRTILSTAPACCYASSNPFVKQTCTISSQISTTYATTSTSTTLPTPVATTTTIITPTVIHSPSTTMTSTTTPQTIQPTTINTTNTTAAPKIVSPPKDPIINTTSFQPQPPPAPVPDSVVIDYIPEITTTELNERTSPDWQKYYFGSTTCTDAKKCSGSADLDKDGLSNNEEYRFGTDPLKTDSDRDGKTDAEEILNGSNPIVAPTTVSNDKITFESPKSFGEVKAGVYQVNAIETITDKSEGKTIKISGKGLPNSYVTVYIFSDPVILTIKTDADGNWSYILDKPLEDGRHEVYVAVTDNTGKVKAKSNPLLFAKTAEAIEIIPPTEASVSNIGISPTQSWFKQSYLIFLTIGIMGIILAVFSIGTLVRNKKTEDDTVVK